jgi:glycosyltransferase involved in cell wall biosynthesis
MYVWHPPLTIGVAAWLISRLRRVPFVYDVQDIWPESALLSGLIREGLMVRLMLRLEKFTYRRAAHILCVTEGARQNIIGKGVAPEKVTVVQHWIDESLLDDVSPEVQSQVRARYGWSNNDFVVMFAGNIGLVQGLDTVVRAAGQFETSDRVKIVFVGDGVDKDRLVALAAELKLGGRVQFLDRQPMNEMPRLFAAADALLVHLRRSELSRYVIPTKTLAYLAAGKPVVVAMEGAAVDLVKESGAGVFVPPDEPAKLAAELRRLAAMPKSELQRLGAAGKTFLERTMTRRRVVPKYDALLRAVAKTR